MKARTIFILLLSGAIILMGVPSTGAESTITLDEFKGGVAESTLGFRSSLLNTSLSIEMPLGATIVSAELKLEGIGGIAAESSKLNFTNGKLGSDVWAFWNEGRGLYPPVVDPTSHQWPALGNREVVLIQKDDGNYWIIDTQDPGVGKPPGAWPIQLFGFKPLSTGATNITVSWNGFSFCSMNKTNPYHAEMWLYDHTDKEWDQVKTYDTQAQVDTWMNYTFDLPSPYIATNGSFDVAIVGLNSEWAGPMLPAFDEGHLYTDFIEVKVASSGGLQFPGDVGFYVDGVEVTTLTGQLMSTVSIGDAEGFTDTLQTVLDSHPVQPDNVSLPCTFSVSAPTPGKLRVFDLLIEYEPVVNEAPVYQGPISVSLDEDSPKKAVLDLDASFADDHNMGELTFSLGPVTGDGADRIVAEIGIGPGGNRSLFVTPEDDFFGGPINVTLRAEDAFSELVTATVEVNVDQVPDRPVMEREGTLEAHERATFHHVVNVTDVDLPDDELTFSDTSAWLDIDPVTGVINWTPGADQIGKHTFDITVTDSYGLFDRALFTIEVMNTNDPPSIVSNLTLTTTQDKETTYIIRVDDPDIPFGDDMSFFAFADAVEVTLDEASGRLTFTPGNDQVPSFPITIRVQDSLGETDEKILVVTVANVNDPPAFAEYDELVYDQNEPVVLQLEASDPDTRLTLPEPEVLTFTGVGMEAFLPTSEGLVTFTADQSMVGTHTVTYTVTDRSGAKDVVTIEWVIVDVNDDPDLLDVLEDTVTIDEDAPYERDLSASDPDGDALTWSDDTALFDIDPATGAFGLTPDQADVGTHTVSITVSDGKGGSATWTFQLVVNNVNDDPVITSVSPKTGSSFDEGKKVPLEATATDEDGDALTYTWKVGKKVLGTGRTLPYDGLEPGEHTITLEVTDGNGGMATEQLKVRVEGGVGIGLMLPIALLVVVIALVAAVLYARSRARAAAAEAPTDAEPGETADKAPETVEEEEILDLGSARVLEYEVESSAPRRSEVQEDLEEPIYDLEHAEVYKVDEEE